MQHLRRRPPVAGLRAILRRSLWLLAAGLLPSASAQERTPCPDAPALVAGADESSLALACSGARDAFAFLRPLGLIEPVAVPVDLVERLPPDLRADAVGCYQKRTRRVYVLTWQRFQARGTWFKVPTSEALYRAVVAHEVAHAIVGCHLDQRQLPAAAHEYVAYVTMFATMDPATRALTLAATPADGIEHDAEINDLRYAYDPMRFGIEAYRHWLRRRDAAGFLKDVIGGGVVPDLSAY